MPNLNVLRESLEEVNSQIFKLIEKRQSLINEIQAFKDKVWDPKREFEFFTSFFHSKNSEVYNAMILSLLIEGQAYSANSNYPRWSQGVHLEHIGNQLHLLNPILLKVIDPQEYEKLDLVAEFKLKIEDAVNE